MLVVDPLKVFGGAATHQTRASSGQLKHGHTQNVNLYVHKQQMIKGSLLQRKVAETKKKNYNRVLWQGDFLTLFLILTKINEIKLGLINLVIICMGTFPLIEPF